MKTATSEVVTVEEQTLLRELFDAMPQLGWRAQPDGFIDYYNQGWYEYTGTTPAQMEGWGWTSVHDPAHLPRVLTEWKAAIAAERPVELEFPLRRHDGQFRWFLTRVVPIRDEAGRLVRWVGINTDVHDQRLAAEELTAQRTRYQALFSQAPVAIGLLRGPSHIIELANPLFCSVLGRQPTELQDRPILEALPEIRGQGFDHLLDGVFRTGVAYVGKGMPATVGPAGARATAFFDFVYEPLLDEQGRPEGIVVIGVDVTAQVQARGRLVEENRRSRFAADVGAALTTDLPIRTQLGACCEAIVGLGAAFARIWVHNEAEEMLELAASGGLYTHLDGGHARVPVGRFKIGLIASERRPHLTNAVLEDPRLSDPAWARREGMVAFAGYPLMLGDRLVGVLGVFARETLSEETFAILGTVADQLALTLERSTNERFREMFIGMLGHDLRNPLSAIRTAGQVLAMDESLSERRRGTAARIVSSSSRMARMVDQLLDYTSARSARGIPIMATPADVFAVCREVAGELEAANPGRRIEVRTTGDGRGHLDVDRMAQVFSNLLGNAISYGDPHGAIVVSLRGEPARLECEVRNHGRPIAPAALPHLFDAFRRANQQKTSATTGLGLGLYITKEIVRAHGGTISVTSSEPDGTAFHFEIPLGGGLSPAQP
ncbi:MAG: PAS domain-containing protein [Myxococcota bacterium]|nr:PAS domain-containing protein [Myxococcota bacterium]